MPWVAPAVLPRTGWMTTGLAVHETLRGHGAITLEVYPYGGFRTLGGRAPLPRKTSRAGRERRIDLLRAAGVVEPRLEAWSHDALDALVAAVVAREFAAGRAVRVGCGHDASAIWLPRPLRPHDGSGAVRRDSSGPTAPIGARTTRATRAPR